MNGVLDASALVRLFVPDGPLPEGLEPFLRGAERGDNTALTPELGPAETVNALNKKRLRGEISMKEAEEILGAIAALPVQLMSHAALLKGALQLAAAKTLTVYDALYLELARTQSARLFTSDEPLLKAARELGLA